MTGRKTKREYSISQKIMRRALLVYLAVLAVSLIFAVALIIPRFRNNAEKNSLDSLTYIRDQYNLIAEDASDYLSGLADSALQLVAERLGFLFAVPESFVILTRVQRQFSR